MNKITISLRAAALAVGLLLPISTLVAQAPASGPNVPMATGTKFPQGDPRMTKKNESSVAISSRSSRTLMAASNDYRLVQMSTAEGLKGAKAWVQIYKSVDGGASWYSTPLGGCPNDLPECADATGLTASLRALHPDFSADPTVRAGPFGTFFFCFIAGTRDDSADGIVGCQRFVDKNNAVQRSTDVRQIGDVNYLKKAQDPILPDKLSHIVTGKTGQFVDKPWNAADVPRPWNAGKTCKLLEWAGPDVMETVPAFNVYVSFANFPGQGQNQHPSAYVAVSEDCGTTFGKPVKVSNSLDASQGTSVAIDPKTGYVYVAWRRFGEPDASPPKPDQIIISRSLDGGKTWSNQPIVVADNIRPYDQDATGASFRTLAFPTLAVSVDAAGTSRVHVGWAQRKNGRPSLLAPSYSCSTGNGADCDARIAIATSSDNGLTWGAPTFVDDDFMVNVYQPGALTPSDRSHSRGHQLQPALTFSAGKLLVTWLDSREDHTEGVLRCPGGGDTCSLTQRVEVREARGNLVAGCTYNPASDPGYAALTDAQKALLAAAFPGNSCARPEAVWTTYVTDGTPGLVRRHTIDAYAAMADPSAAPTFTAARVSQYAYGSTAVLDGSGNPIPGTYDIRQKQISAPNLPMFSQGRAAFLGDYIDANGPVIVATGNATRPYKWNVGGKWNVDGVTVSDYMTGGQAPVFHVTFTDNRLVVPPKNGNWAEPTCIDAGPEPCASVIGFAGNRNQNVFSTIVAPSSVAYANANSKLLRADTPRGFVVTVDNLSSTATNAYTLTINPPPLPSFPTGTRASFDRDTLSVTGSDVTSVTVTVQPRSSATRTVWVKSGTQNASVVVGISGPAYSTQVVLNPDPNPLLLVPIQDGGAQDVANNDLGNITLSNAVLTNAVLSNNALSNNALTNGVLSNIALTNAMLTNVTLTNAALTNATLSNNALSNIALTNDPLASVALTNDTLENIALTNAVLTNNALTNIALTNIALTNVTLSNVTLSNNALTNVTLSNNALSNIALTNATLTNATLNNATLSNNALTNNALTNNALSNNVLSNITLTNSPLDDSPDKLASYEQANPDLANNPFASGDIDNTSPNRNFADATFTIRNRGNADTTLAIKLLLRDATNCDTPGSTCGLPSGVKLQMVLRKIALTPSVIAPTAPAGTGTYPPALKIGLTQTNAQVSNVFSPVPVNPADPNLGKFVVGDAEAATLPLGPGERAYITIRATGGPDFDPRELLRWGAKLVAVDASNQTRTHIPLVIQTLKVPKMTALTPTTFQLLTFGGYRGNPVSDTAVKGTLTWMDAAGNPITTSPITGLPNSGGQFDFTRCGALPLVRCPSDPGDDRSLYSTSVTPNAYGTFKLLVTVNDASVPTQQDQQLYDVVIDPAQQTAGDIVPTGGGLPQPPTIVYGQPVILQATSPSGQPVTFFVSPVDPPSPCTITANTNPTGSYTLTSSSVGQCVIGITLNGNTTYQTVTVNNWTTVDITPAPATLTLGNLTSTYDGTAKPATVTTAPAGLSSVSVTYDGNAAPPTNAGSYAVVASLNNPNYVATNATGTLVISKAAATLTLGNLTPTYDGTPKPATVTTAPAGLGGVSVTYNGSATAPTNAGTYAVAASLDNPNYAASNATGTLVIGKAAATLTLGNLTPTYDGTPKPATVTTAPAGLGGVSVTYNGSATAPTNAGTYAVAASLDNPNYAASNATGTLVIGKATATLTLGNLTPTYDGTPKPATVTTAPAGLGGVSVTYNGNATAPTTAGTYAVVASLDNPNYAATSAAGNLVIGKAITSTTLSPASISATVGQPVTLNASIAANPSVSGAPPSGTVSFKEGATSLATVTLGTGPTPFSKNDFAVGDHSITATYNGDNNFQTSSSAPSSVSIGKKATTTTLAASPNPASFGTTVTLTATVSSTPTGGAAPTGSVKFYDGANELGAGTINGGTASFSTGQLAVGPHSVTASYYAGDANNGSSTSLPLTVTINPAFVTTGAMTQPRSYHTSTLLNDGRVLVAGGFDASGGATASSEVYCAVASAVCPASAVGKFTAVGNLPSKSAAHGASLLPDGRVLVTGGGNSSAETFNGSTWTSAGGMSSVRSYHTATKLPDGQVLLVGGADNASKTLQTTILFNPTTGSFTNGPTMAVARERHTAILLTTGPHAGKVLVVGGRQKSGNSYVVLKSVEICSATVCTGNFATTPATIPLPQMTGVRFAHATTMLSDGKVLVSGGSSDTASGGGTTALNTAEIYDSAANTWTSVAMFAARREHTITRLFDGKLLATGGLSSTPLASSESFTGGAAAFANGATMIKARFGHRATRLPDGRVLITGGTGATSAGAIGTAISDAELYMGPAYSGPGTPPAEP